MVVDCRRDLKVSEGERRSGHAQSRGQLCDPGRIVLPLDGFLVEQAGQHLLSIRSHVQTPGYLQLRVILDVYFAQGFDCLHKDNA